MGTECEWKREAFGKNSKWGSQKSVDNPDSPVPQTPPPIPAPPKEAQSNLTKDPPSGEKTKKIVRKNKSDGKSTKKSSEVTKANKDGIPPPPPPPPPSMIPNAPPPPPPPGGPNLEENPELAKARKNLVDQIKKASRTRPDWKTLMKDLEGGVRLKHVKSSDKLDRSSPILPEGRGKGGKFYYDSEKTDPVKNQLFAEIHRGVKLRRTRTDDRSRPDFQKLGLKKVRKQMTSEEKKAIPVDAPEALPSSSDEEEDIDKMRDDLKATKLQLADEIKKTKKMEREAKITQIDIDSFKAEVKKLKRQLKEAGVHEVKPIRDLQAADMAPKLSKSMSKLRMKEEDMDFSDLDIIDEEIKSLKDQIDAQRKRAEKAEGKIEELNQKMSLVSNGSDEWELRSIYFEKKYKALQKDQGIELPDINCIAVQTDPIEVVSSPSVTFVGQPLPTKKSASRKSFGLINKMQSFKEEDEEEESESSSEESETDSSEESDEEEGSENDNASTRLGEEREESRLDRDVNFWQNKLSQVKDKERICRQERTALRNKILKYYKDMRTERKEYLRVKQELDEMASALREVNDELEEEEEEDEESESEEESSESGDWWDDETKKKPKKLKKKKPSNVNGDDKSEDENLEDMSTLDDPEWPDSGAEDSASDDEDEPLNIRIRKLQNRTTNHEDTLNAVKKESHNLKTQVTRCDEMYNEEKRRHQRFDNELQMLLTALE